MRNCWQIRQANRAPPDLDVGQVGVVKRAYRAERRAGINDQIAKAKAKAKRQESNKPAPITAGSLVLCDKLCPSQLLDLGAYLIVCAYHNQKPTVGTAFIPFRPLATAAAGRGSPLKRTTAVGDYNSKKNPRVVGKNGNSFCPRNLSAKTPKDGG